MTKITKVRSNLLSPNFTTDEFVRGSGYTWDDVPIEHKLNVCRLVSTVLQPLRDYIGAPIIIHSGLRTPAVNKRSGGAEKSQHLYGRAADIRCSNYAPRALFDLLDEWQRQGKVPVGGLSCYDSAERAAKGKTLFVHVDIRGELARW